MLLQRWITAAGLGGGLTAGLFAAGSAPDKSGYGLGHPVPPALLRELSTDRPDATESPFTVDAGHAQLEMDLVNRADRTTADGPTSGWGIAPFNLRLGVTRDFELGVFLIPYVEATDRPAGAAPATHAGSGDVTFRAKVNFRGNDGGPTAFGLIVDAKLPTASSGLGNGVVEGAIFLPLSFELGGGWGLGAMTGANFVQVDSGGRRCGWVNTATVGHDLTEIPAFYVELATEVGVAAPTTTFDTGLTFKVNTNMQFDVGAQFGLSQAADDGVVFTGLAYRF